MTGELHTVSDEEAERLVLRAEALRRFRARYAHNLESQRAMVGGLRRLATVFSQGRLDERTFPWELLVDEELTGQLWSTVADGYARKTAAKDASALRIMLDYCRRVGLITHEEYGHARNFEAKGGQPRMPAGHFLTEPDVVRIITTCGQGADRRNTRVRDVALLLSLASSGARGDELMGVDLNQTFLEERRLWLSRTKGGEPRNAWLHPVAVDALQRWLQVRGMTPGPLFVPLSRTGRPLLPRRLSTHQCWKVVQRRAAEAGLPGITPHDMRRFLISNLLEHVDLVLVAKVVGHKNPATTAGYDRRPLARQREAVATLALPAMQAAALGTSDPP